MILKALRENGYKKEIIYEIQKFIDLIIKLPEPLEVKCIN